MKTIRVLYVKRFVGDIRKITGKSSKSMWA
jgi:hypothetical protein